MHRSRSADHPQRLNRSDDQVTVGGIQEIGQGIDGLRISYLPQGLNDLQNLAFIARIRKRA